MTNTLAGVFNGDGAKAAGSVRFQQRILVQIAGIVNCGGGEFNILISRVLATGKCSTATTAGQAIVCPAR